MAVYIDEFCSFNSVERFLPINFIGASVSVGGYVLKYFVAPKAEKETKQRKID